MKTFTTLTLILLAICLYCGKAMADKQTMAAFGEKVLLRAGAKYVNQDTRIRLDGDDGVGAYTRASTYQRPPAPPKWAVTDLNRSLTYS